VIYNYEKLRPFYEENQFLIKETEGSFKDKIDDGLPKLIEVNLS